MKRFFPLILTVLCHTVHSQPIPDSFLTTGIQLINEGHFEKAVDVLTKRVDYAKQNRQSELLISLYTNLGNAHSQMSHVMPAVKYYQLAIDEAEAGQNERKVAAIMVNLGALFSEQKHFDDALKLFSKAEKVALHINDTMLLADIANNRGVIYEQQERYDKALANYHTALQYYELLRLPYNMALAYNNIAIVYKFLKNYPEAVRYYSASLEKAGELKDEFMLSVNENNLANIYYEQKNYQKAVELHTRSLNRARAISAQNVVVAALESLADDYAALKNYKAAHFYQKQFQKLNDSLFNAARSQQLTELQTRYETTKKEKEISDLKQKEQIYQLKIERQQLSIVAIIFLTVLVLFSAYLFYSRKLLKTKQAKEKAILDAEYNERMRIARDVHDDLGSGLTHIKIMAEAVSAKPVYDAGVVKDLRHISATAKALIENMRDMIWVLNPQNTTLDHLFAHMREHCSNYLEENHVGYHLQLPENFIDQKISREVQRNLFLCVKESLHNCIKHADASFITISAALKNQSLLIEISDNGKGCSDAGNTKGNGIWNMNHRMVSIEGGFSIQSASGGCTVRLHAPLSKTNGGFIKTKNSYFNFRKKLFRRRQA